MLVTSVATLEDIKKNMYIYVAFAMVATQLDCRMVCAVSGAMRARSEGPNRRSHRLSQSAFIAPISLHIRSNFIRRLSLNVFAVSTHSIFEKREEFFSPHLVC